EPRMGRQTRVVISIGPSGLSLFIYGDPGAARYALAPGYLLAAPSARRHAALALLVPALATLWLRLRRDVMLR
ncbi:MAG TPA: hypothetical protein VFT02_04825, partial [Pyrinomonadaceae bacterium]|nr:hypothetical protein [Pyrinomonadaceae bacterium]